MSDWLTDPGSLTARLEQHCPGRFRVRLLGQRRARPEASEAIALGLRRGVMVLVREVQLLCAEQPVVFARSLIPPRTMRGRHRRLGHLGERPLGAYLFAQPDLHRRYVELARLQPGEDLHAIAGRGLQIDDVPVWGRRSLFVLGSRPLLVSEFFLPTLLAGQRR